MTAAIDKRTYLVNLGLAKPGRGKFSNDAKKALSEAEAKGVVFIDKVAVAKAEAEVRAAEREEKKAEKPEVNIYGHHPVAIRSGLLPFKNGRTKLVVNATEACHACRCSFGWCYCDTPTFLYWKDGQVYSLTY